MVPLIHKQIAIALSQPAFPVTFTVKQKVELDGVQRLTFKMKFKTKGPHKESENLRFQTWFLTQGLDLHRIHLMHRNHPDPSQFLSDVKAYMEQVARRYSSEMWAAPIDKYREKPYSHCILKVSPFDPPQLGALHYERDVKRSKQLTAAWKHPEGQSLQFEVKTRINARFPTAIPFYDGLGTQLVIRDLALATQDGTLSESEKKRAKAIQETLHTRSYMGKDLKPALITHLLTSKDPFVIHSGYFPPPENGSVLGHYIAVVVHQGHLFICNRGEYEKASLFPLKMATKPSRDIPSIVHLSTDSPATLEKALQVLSRITLQKDCFENLYTTLPSLEGMTYHDHPFGTHAHQTQRGCNCFYLGVKEAAFAIDYSLQSGQKEYAHSQTFYEKTLGSEATLNRFLPLYLEEQRLLNPGYSPTTDPFFTGITPLKKRVKIETTVQSVWTELWA